MNKPLRTPLSELFLGVWHLLSVKKLPVFIASVSFAMLFAVGSAGVQFRIAAVEDAMMQEFSMDQAMLRTTVDEQLTRMSSANIQEFLESARLRYGSGSAVLAESVGADALGMTYMFRVAPFAFLQLLFNAVVTFVAATFFLLLFTGGSRSAYETAGKLPLMVLKMIGLLIWMLVRSLIWIPFAGPLIALFMFPRLALAPVHLASGETGIFPSIQMSLKRTKGHWFFVFVRLLVSGITAFLILWPLLVFVVGVALFSVKLGYIVLLLVFMFFVAYNVACLTVLAAMMTHGEGTRGMRGIKGMED